MDTKTETNKDDGSTTDPTKEYFGESMNTIKEKREIYGQDEDGYSASQTVCFWGVALVVFLCLMTVFYALECAVLIVMGIMEA